MAEQVTIYVNGKDYQVPKGSNLVDAAKFYAGDDIPVFCYHPKLSPVGMCRMCLVEMGNIARDRATNEIVLDENGNPKVNWMPKLQTACTQTCTDGLHVRTNTPTVQKARDDVIEFILSSHPLDCPICDKGGECPLQNLTMRHGAGASRFEFDDKMHLDKHVPLGELIYLDRERCIQCARCTRFCDELAGDPVLGFHERGRALQIVTISNPPFDTYYSGNTTDICPVGALTTADFRFGARPWELNEVPSLDPYGPEGANISLSTRLDRDSGGITIVKRVMPRQNEFVNEIWISDKTRFGHHHSRAANRLTAPMVRKNGQLVECTWDEALSLLAEKLKAANGKVGAVAGPMLSNEDLWELRRLVEKAGGGHLGVFPPTMTGADIVAQVGVASGTNLVSRKTTPTGIGPETAILVIASDLQEEAPIWWLRVKRAGDNSTLYTEDGSKIIVLNARSTALDAHADCALHYEVGHAVEATNHLIQALISASKLDDEFIKGRTEGVEALKKAKYGDLPAGYEQAAHMIAQAENLIVFVGAEGVTLEQHRELMQAASNLLSITGHVGKPNNGLIPVWAGANVQGAFDLGYSAEATAAALGQAVVILAGADPASYDLAAQTALSQAGFRVALTLFENASTAQADLVLPRQSVPERDGTFTNGERRVQRFYTAQGFLGQTRPDWKIFAEAHRALDPNYKVKPSAGAVMAEITQHVPRYAQMSYKALAQVIRQFPDVGGEDLYYGGTAYNNKGGVGLQWPVEAESGAKISLKPADGKAPKKEKGLLALPVRVLYDRTPEFSASALMQQRIPQAYAELHAEDAHKLKVAEGDSLRLTFAGQQVSVKAHINGSAPKGVVLVPLYLADAPVPWTPGPVTVEKE
jgi:NADH-quinone oxidoreductase subunit G